MITRNSDTLACTTATTLMCGHISQEAVHPRLQESKGYVHTLHLLTTPIQTKPYHLAYCRVSHLDN